MREALFLEHSYERPMRTKIDEVVPNSNAVDDIHSFKTPKVKGNEGENSQGQGLEEEEERRMTAWGKMGGSCILEE